MKIERTALVTHSAEKMYRLVHDVIAYPQFLKWCKGAEVHEETELQQLASLEVSVAGVSQKFTTRNQLLPGESLVLSLVDGPFKNLTGTWLFKTLEPSACKVSLCLDFDFRPGLISAAFQRGFKGIADRLVQEFCLRADEVYLQEDGQ